ncbi:hypothetical protein WJX75_000590 [Coccomyxa subellipsoidea]|uniref:MADS-box domain-containing protein n=1 Tax=Coccomyxa subellipsoidea TaxID=248742 RepID=A0ABR2YG06_9CHLO
MKTPSRSSKTTSEAVELNWGRDGKLQHVNVCRLIIIIKSHTLVYAFSANHPRRLTKPMREDFSKRLAGNGDPARAAAKEEGGSHQHVAHNEIDAPESPCGNAACSTEEHTSQIHGREDAGIAQEPGDLPLSAAAAPQHVSQRTCHYSDSSQGRGDNAPARDTEKNQEMRVVLRTVDHLISENRALKTAGQEREAAGPHHRTTAFTSSAEIVRVAI